MQPLLRISTRKWAALKPTLAAGLMLALACPVFPEESPKSGEKALTFASHLQPFLKKYCVDCHGNDKAKGDINFERHGPQTRLYESTKEWKKVQEMLLMREMPPEKKAQPSESERESIVNFIETELAKFDCDGPVNPGRVTLRRLNRAEYRNTIRDLLAIDIDPTKEFPADEVGYGFDNIGDVLSLPPMLMEKYLDAAETAAAEAVDLHYPPPRPRKHVKGETLQAGGDRDAVRPVPGRGLGLYRNANGHVVLPFQRSGPYVIRVRASGDQAGGGPPKMAVQVDDQKPKVFDVTADREDPAVYETHTEITAGKHTIYTAYLNNWVDFNHPDPDIRGDRNLYVHWIEIEGPLDAAPEPPSESHARIFVCDPEHVHKRSCATTILRDFATRAFRRPVTDDEVKRLAGLVSMVQRQKGSFNEGIQLAVQAVLSSPSFLFRWELDPEPTAPKGIRNLNDFELASRLSYFLWSSMPDKRLMDLAQKNLLHRPDILKAETQRMLEDPRSRALVENFGGQWLQTRNLETMTPDPEVFPDFNDALRHGMQRETELFFDAVMREDRSIRDFLDANFTFVNGPMAAFYGIEGVKGDQFQRVSLDPKSGRGGILTHASILTITSSPTRTSPVIRGKWILEQILGTPPPPPPANVPELEEGKEAIQSATLRQRMEMHRSNPECATCHNKMDALGFAFENFNGIGKWRERDGKFPIDPSGTLPSGQSFSGPAELKGILKSEEAFVRCLAEKLLTFALGRGLEYYDKCAVDDICSALKANDFRFSALVNGVVQSEPFMKKQVGSEAVTARNN